MKRFAACIGLLCAGVAFAQSGDEQGQLDFADGLFARGFHEDAATEYRRYLETYPEGGGRGTAWLRLGLSQAALKDTKGALASFDKAAAEGSSDGIRQQALLRKGVAQLSAGMNAEAVDSLGTLIAAKPTDELLEESYYQISKAYTALERTDEALESLDTLVSTYPEGRFADFARYQTAFVRLKRGEFERAAVAFTQVADREGANPQLRMDSIYRAAEAYDRLGWFQPAVKSFERLFEEYPDSTYAGEAVYGYAWALYHAGRYAEALRQAERFLETKSGDPRTEGIVYLVGNALQQQKRYEEALTAFARVTSEFPESPYAVKAAAKSAWTLHFLGRDEDALRAAEAFMNAHPTAEDGGETAYLLGELYRKKGQYREASAWFGRVYKEFPKNSFAPESLYKLAECNALAEAWPEAALGFDEFVSAYPEHRLVRDALAAGGDSYMAAGDFAKAAERYAKVLEKDGDAPNGEIQYRLAVAHHNAGQTDEALTIFTAIAGTDGNPYRAEAERRLGDDLLRRKKDPVAAIERFQRALELEPEGAAAGETKKGMALARFEAKDWEGAADTFFDVMQSHPSVTLNADTYVWTGQHYLDNGAPKKAAQTWELLLKRVPDYANAARVRFSIAEAWEGGKDWEKARAAYTAAAEAAPQSTLAVEANFRIARVLEAEGNTDGAMHAYAQAAQSDSGDTAARARLRMGEMLSAQGKHEEAAREFMRVGILFLHPEYSPEGLYRAAESFEASGNREQAASLYQELIRDYPESKRAPDAQARLDASQAD